MRRMTWSATVFMVAMSASTALAHPHHTVHVHTTGFEAGLLHPLLGLDHLLAMLTVGILAVLSGGRSLWLLPTSFLAAMFLGGMVGIAGWSLPASETGIALSVVLLGAAVAARRAPPHVLSIIACTVFGYFHGQAHGAEMPSINQPLLYVAGFVLTTASLHFAGILIGRFFTQTSGRRLQLRLAGGATALAGLALMLRI